MTLEPNVGSDRSWVWNVAADYADGEPQEELLAIRFANSDSECCVSVELCRSSHATRSLSNSAGVRRASKNLMSLEAVGHLLSDFEKERESSANAATS